MEYVDVLKEVSKNEDWNYDENNSINNFLYHQLYLSDNYPNKSSSIKVKNDFRLKHDCDAFYYKNIGYSDGDALFADSMISYWMPYKSRLQELGKEYDYKKPNKNDKKGTEKFRELINSHNDKILQLNENKLMIKFTKLIYTKGNFMRLPQYSEKYSGRKMQGRGGYDDVCDEIDWTLKQCHNGGIYFKYFDYDETKVNEWIRQEKLEMADSSFLSSNMYKLYQDMNEDEFYEYLSKVIELIEYRNKNYHPEEFINRR